ncbi:MAG: response regulator [Elusimicrobiota bacterium]
MADERAKILLVEDEVGYQELAASLLSAEYDVTVCSTAEDACEKLDQEEFALVISDINMFGMTGLELLAKLKREGKSEKCPVVLCSAQSDPATKQIAMAQGAAGFIGKPFPIAQLTTLVAALLSK